MVPLPRSEFKFNKRGFVDGAQTNSVYNCYSSMNKEYCVSLWDYERWETRKVAIGKLVLGGDEPIRVQSMTTTDTMDTEATVAESIRMIQAGCELVRITAPSKKDAENLRNIRDALHAKGYDVPLVADIHFTPNAAEIAAQIVEKVRVNPGNYADKKKFEVLEYTDETYLAELERIRERFTPLVLLCKEHGTAMRIGTNHGSLSDRILSRYGDTPRGMVESAMEFLRICRDHDFHDIVLSMKASNPQVMVFAYRLLVHEMRAQGMNYPLHLGVTEAGEAEDGRIKSAVGIGTLLEDGLGDTIRVSLTEAPEAEIPVARQLLARYQRRKSSRPIPPMDFIPIDPFSYKRRPTRVVKNIGGSQFPVVCADLSDRSQLSPASLFPLGYQYAPALDKWNIGDQACDYIFIGEKAIDFEIPGTLGVIQEASIWQERPRTYPIHDAQHYAEGKFPTHSALNFVRVQAHEYRDAWFDQWSQDSTVVLVLQSDNAHAMPEMRRFMFELIDRGIEVPVIFFRAYPSLGEEESRLYASTDFGALLIDGLGDGLWMVPQVDVHVGFINATLFGILQATRMRMSKTEYISCPSCGRTLFDLQETTAKIRARTDHLKGVKIGIMGCIVNGPGEMADADYGYVGTGPGKITLYKEKEVVKRNIPAEHALDELIQLIRDHGDWVEPSIRTTEASPS